MMSKGTLKDFPWPLLSDGGPVPLWAGDGFVVGTQKRRILAFNADESHWSPELTRLHEEEAGTDHPIDAASRKAAVDSLRRFVIPEAPVILDVGCSSGYVLQEIRKALPRAALIGSDYIVAPLATLAERMPDLPILQFDLRRCPLPDGCVDAVTALNVLEHIDDDALALRQIARILRPGGVVHIEVPAGGGLYDIYDEQLMHHRRYRLRELLAKARDAGFDVLRATHLGFVLFPAFWFVKRRNRRLLTLPEAEKKAIVARQIRRTGQSRVLDLALRLEETVGRAITYPMGIRCVTVLRKPS